MECQSTSPEAWCGDEWCYVTDDCTLAKKPSSYRLGRFYSYSKCGYLDRFTSAYLEGESFKDQAINVVVMTNSGGWKGSYCERDGECSGPTFTLLQDLIERTGAIQNVSMTFYGGPLAAYPDAYPEQVMSQVLRDGQTSAFTACAYATGMGYVDICIGAFTATPARDLLSYNIDLGAEPVYLVSPLNLDTQDSLTANLSRAFAPFTGPAWLCILAFIFVGSMLLMWQERAPGGSFSQVSCKYAVFDATYVGFNSFFAASHGFNPVTIGGRITTLALGLIILLTVSAYTANLAAFLVADSEPKATISSIDAILANPQYKVCTQDSTYLVSNLNFPESQTVLIDGRREVLDAIGVRCEAGVMALEDFEAGQTDGSLCHLTRVGDPLFYEAQMSPVSERFKRSATFIFGIPKVRVHGQTLWRCTSPRMCVCKLALKLKQTVNRPAWKSNICLDR